VIAIAITLAAVLAAPGNLEAAEAAQHGERAYAAERFSEAASAFAEAYRLDPKPAYLYALAQAERLGDRCDLAIEHYEAFVRRVSDEVAAQTARTNIEACNAALATMAPPAAPLEPEVEPEPDETPVDSPSTSPVAPARDPWGMVAVCAGAALLVTGATLQGVARREQGRADRADHVFAYEQGIERAVRLDRASIPVLVVGGALALGGIVRLAVLARRSGRTPKTAWAVDAAGLHLRF
jgi:tetratricopeptide (TPR) repeat protein